MSRIDIAHPKELYYNEGVSVTATLILTIEYGDTATADSIKDQLVEAAYRLEKHGSLGAGNITLPIKRATCRVIIHAEDICCH